MPTAVARPTSDFEMAQRIYRPKIEAFAHQKFRTLPGTDPDDLVSELLEVLWLCTNTYNPNKGAKFNTYFWECAKRRFLDLHKAASRRMRVGDYDRVWIEAEALTPVIERNTQGASAEDEVLARMTVREHLLMGRKPLR